MLNVIFYVFSDIVRYYIKCNPEVVQNPFMNVSMLYLHYVLNVRTLVKLTCLYADYFHVPSRNYTMAVGIIFVPNSFCLYIGK